MPPFAIAKKSTPGAVGHRRVVGNHINPCLYDHLIKS